MCGLSETANANLLEGGNLTAAHTAGHGFGTNGLSGCGHPVALLDPPSF